MKELEILKDTSKTKRKVERVIEKLIFMGYSRGKYPPPGAIVEQLSEEDRATLAHAIPEDFDTLLK